ncbi:MAG: FGGY-family carbohydrate kinase [Aphanothece sp. CMT-3BRIN-NPC111]|jgi:xylulokinase|nr:FGGY-family carbohydrate kinase [Aphanothece sp. CMT-3BRIN-NPC111]
MNLYLGIDFGTSGARAVVIDTDRIIQAEAQYPFESTADLAASWEVALFSLILQIPQKLRKEIIAIAINGTSSTVLLCDAAGQLVDTPILYNDARGVEVMEKLREIAPPNHTVISATSSLAKLLWMTQQPSFTCRDVPVERLYFLHQADWLAFLLHGQLGISDYHNALKLGYDVEHLCYPTWLKNLPVSHLFPKVLPPGTPVSEVTADIANRFSLPPECLVIAGTTDSIAAFLASGAKSPGEAVTSLGSTLVLKLLSQTRVDDPRYGIYSHRLPLLNNKGKGGRWLVGGASNTGGAVLRHFFCAAELESLSRHIDTDKESPLDYYPLLREGDRFPINDPHLLPRLEPRPGNPAKFLHGLLESIARIEARGYQLLQQLGATQLSCVYTAGGGAKNPAWTAIRARHLQVPIVQPMHAAAAYGTALLALRHKRSNVK